MRKYLLIINNDILSIDQDDCLQEVACDKNKVFDLKVNRGHDDHGLFGTMRDTWSPSKQRLTMINKKWLQIRWIVEYHRYVQITSGKFIQVINNVNEFYKI